MANTPNNDSMERCIELKHQLSFKRDTGSKFSYCHQAGFYCETLSSDPELLNIFKRYYCEYSDSEPWSKIFNKNLLKKIPITVFEQKAYCDGTFLREENAMLTSAEGRINYGGYKGPFYQGELLILYLSAVDRMLKLQRKDELIVVSKFLELNRKSFRGQGRKDLQNTNLTKINNNTRERYIEYFKPILTRISDLIKTKGSGSFRY